jgi:NAD(P)H-hydrate repair Nnr-like enzyme with NAD(P)H-hydrate dehydratase domain
VDTCYSWLVAHPWLVLQILPPNVQYMQRLLKSLIQQVESDGAELGEPLLQLHTAILLSASSKAAEEQVITCTCIGHNMLTPTGSRQVLTGSSSSSSSHSQQDVHSTTIQLFPSHDSWTSHCCCCFQGLWRHTPIISQRLALLVTSMYVPGIPLLSLPT